MDMFALAQLRTRSLVKNKTFAKNLVLYFFSIFEICPKKRCFRPIFQFFWVPKFNWTKLWTTAPQSTLLLSKSPKNGSSFAFFDPFLIFPILHVQKSFFPIFSHFWPSWVSTGLIRWLQNTQNLS